MRNCLFPYSPSARRKPLLVFFVFVTLLLPASFCLAQDDTDETDDAVAIFNQGQEAHEKGKLEEAIKLYEKALNILPEFPEAELQRGNAYVSLGKIGEAEKAFRRALEFREDWSLALASLGAVLVREDQFAEAEKVLGKAIQLDEQNFPAITAMADLRLKTHAAPEILKSLLATLKTLSSKANPPASILASQGAIENALGDAATAKKSLERALSVDPNNRAALFDRAEIALAESDFTRAGEIVKLLAKIAPDSPDLGMIRARVLLGNDKPDEALSILEAVREPTPQMLSLRDKILANRTVNVAELESQLAKDGKNVAVLGRLCVVLRTREPLKALDYCKRAFEIDPGNIAYAVGYGAALVQAKTYEPAIELFQKILRVAPDNTTVRANLATALFQMKRFAEAKAEYQWLIEKQPDLVIAYYLLGITHDQLGEYLDAMANYQIFLRKADPDQNKLEIEKINLRLPDLQKLIKEKKGKN